MLHKCSANEHVAGKPAHLVSAAFSAIGYRWKAFTVHEPASSSYQVVLQLRDSRMPLPCDVFVTPAPSPPAPMVSSCASHTFAPRHRSTEPLLVASDAAAGSLAETESLTLRIGLVDRRAGRPSRAFLGQEGGYGGQDYSSDEGVLGDADSGSDSDRGSNSDYSGSDEAAEAVMAGLYAGDHGRERRFGWR